MARKKTVSLAISPVVVSQLREVSKRLGVSRSAVANEILAGALDDLNRILDRMPAGDVSNDSESLKRLRGDSAAVVQSRITDLQTELDKYQTNF